VGIGVNGMFCGSAYWPYASSAVIRLNHNGTVTLMEGDVEFGQGADTACCQIAAEELGLPLEDVTLIAGDSELCPLNYSNFLSGGVFVGGGAVLNAARDLRQKILSVGSEVLEVKVEELDLRNRSVFIRAKPETSVPLGELLRYSTQKHQGDPLIGVGYRKAVPEIEFYPSLSKGTGRFTDAYGFTAATAEVEVDRETGRVKVLKIVVADDVGFEINPVAIRGQMLSQAVMGMGDALMEEVIDERGRVLNPTLVDYEIPRALDVPEIVVLNGSDYDPKGPYGAKEAGECARAAVIPAIANAVYDAVGVRVHRLPITPERLLNALKNKGK
jgi:4-hydroxybenzoyl-CoA reductase subunit alpha